MVFLQVLDEGQLTDGQGRLVDFRLVAFPSCFNSRLSERPCYAPRNAVIIMTSNVGADILSASECGDGPIPEQTRVRVMERFRQIQFPAEYLNRIDEVVMFVSVACLSIQLTSPLTIAL